PGERPECHNRRAGRPGGTRLAALDGIGLGGSHPAKPWAPRAAETHRDSRMKSLLLAASAAALLLAAGPAAAQGAQPTAADAKAFVDQAESQLASMNEYAAKASWVRANFITEDTQWLEAKATAEQSELGTKLAKQAARFNGV